MFGRKPRVKCFNATYSAGAYAARADLGYQLVPVDRIVGSVGRCDDLDRQFQPLRLTRDRQSRLARIRQLAAEGAILPPVELYRLKDEYFVVDGNHRVAVAKENGQVDIDAYVVEFLPSGQRAEDQLYLERHAFAQETGLDGIHLGQLGGYDRLQEEIQRYRQALSAAEGRDVTLREAATSWYRRVFEPVARDVAARRLPQRAGKSSADLYLDLQTQRDLVRREQHQDPGWEEAIARLEALHPLPTLGERLRSAWAGLAGTVEAWWRGLRAEDPPCVYALQARDGTIHCRRTAHLRQSRPGV
jgi:hypothetical protein